MMIKNSDVMILKCGLIALVLFTFLGCPSGTKTTRPGQLFAVPPDIAVDIDSFVPQHHPVYVYWSQTQSERGYVLDNRGAIAPSPEFVHFFNAFNETLRYGYAPTYHRLKLASNGFVRWAEIADKDFDPTARAFYEIGGDFENNRGPLTMLYQDNFVKADDLTVVISDLEEQRLNNTVLAGNIRALLSSPNNAAAVIALKLPFYGTNYKPDPNNLSREIPQQFNGEQKPLYMIVTGMKDAVAVFVSSYEPIARKSGVDSRVVTTLYPGDVNKALKASDVIIPESASLANQTRVDKNKRVLSDLWNYRNITDGVPFRVWNLRNQTSSMVNYVGTLSESGELTAIREPLNLKLLQYKAIGGGAKNGHGLWQVNVAYNLPTGYNASKLDIDIDNYRYWVGGGWETSEALKKRDLEAAVFPIPDSDQAGVYVVPLDKKRGILESSVVCFDVVLRAPVSIPSWVREFDDDGDGTTKGKTLRFDAFVGLVLGLDASGDPKIIPGNELSRTTVVLFDMPSQKKRK